MTIKWDIFKSRRGVTIEGLQKRGVALTYRDLQFYCDRVSVEPPEKDHPDVVSAYSKEAPKQTSKQVRSPSRIADSSQVNEAPAKAPKKNTQKVPAARSRKKRSKG